MTKITALFGASLLLCASTLPFAAVAQTPTSDAVEATDEIIVTGTRFRVPLDQVGRSVSVVTAEEIELRQQRFVFDALEVVPGLQVTRSGSFGGITGVSVRGLPSDQTLVVQDGIVLNDAASFGNSFNASRFQTIDVQRIEVLRGAQSTLYGSDAIGGVINIITQDGHDGFGGEAYLEGGSFNTVRGGATIFGGNDLASGRISATGVTTDGFSTADEALGNTEDDGFDNVTLSARGRLQAHETVTLEGVLRFQDSRSEFDDVFGTFSADADRIDETKEASAAVILTQSAFGTLLENRYALTYSQTERVNLNQDIVDFDALGKRLALEYQGTLRPADWITIIGGGEYEAQESEVSVGFGANQEIESVSGFGLVQLQPTEFITLTGGLRHDSSDDFEDQTTFSLSGVIEVPQTGTLFRGSVAEGFKAPSAGEFSFNANLRPEFADGWDIGLEQPFLGGRARFTATYFDQEIEDLIAFNLAVFTFENIQEFTSEGFELALDVDVNGWLTVNAAYTHVDALNLSTNIAAGNQPDDRVSVTLDARPTDRTTLSLGVVYNGEEESGPATLDDFFLVNLRGSFAVTETVEIFGRVENLLDENYQDVLGFGTAPLSGFGGVRARF
jgi:vitamin B12 transporter